MVTGPGQPICSGAGMVSTPITAVGPVAHPPVRPLVEVTVSGVPSTLYSDDTPSLCRHPDQHSVAFTSRCYWASWPAHTVRRARPVGFPEAGAGPRARSRGQGAPLRPRTPRRLAAGLDGHRPTTPKAEVAPAEGANWPSVGRQALRDRAWRVDTRGVAASPSAVVDAEMRASLNQAAGHLVRMPSGVQSSE